MGVVSEQDQGVSRVEALEAIIRDTLWMACRYAHGRQSWAVGSYNEAARRAVALGVIAPGQFETFAIDGSLSAAMSGLMPDEFREAMALWSDPRAIRTHVPRMSVDEATARAAISGDQ